MEFLNESYMSNAAGAVAENATIYTGAALGSGRNSDFSEFRFRPELIKNHGRNRNFVIFWEIEYQVYLLNSIGRNLGPCIISKFKD